MARLVRSWSASLQVYSPSGQVKAAAAQVVSLDWDWEKNLCCSGSHKVGQARARPLGLGFGLASEDRCFIAYYRDTEGAPVPVITSGELVSAFFPISWSICLSTSHAEHIVEIMFSKFNFSFQPIDSAHSCKLFDNSFVLSVSDQNQASGVL
jgi:hypothetical protein